MEVSLWGIMTRTGEEISKKAKMGPEIKELLEEIEAKMKRGSR